MPGEQIHTELSGKLGAEGPSKGAKLQRKARKFIVRCEDTVTEHPHLGQHTCRCVQPLVPELIRTQSSWGTARSGSMHNWKSHLTGLSNTLGPQNPAVVVPHVRETQERCFPGPTLGRTGLRHRRWEQRGLSILNLQDRGPRRGWPWNMNICHHFPHPQRLPEGLWGCNFTRNLNYFYELSKPRINRIWGWILRNPKLEFTGWWHLERSESHHTKSLISCRSLSGREVAGVVAVHANAGDDWTYLSQSGSLLPIEFLLSMDWSYWRSKQSKA